MTSIPCLSRSRPWRHFTDNSVGRGVAVERDAQRCLTLCFKCLSQERLGRSHIPFPDKPEVHGVSVAIDPRYR